MNLIKSIFILFVIVSCQEKIIWQETYTDKTIKLESKEFKAGSTNYIYNWSKPNGPDSTISYTIEHNKMLINPQIPGEYIINLSIDNLSNKRVHEEKFYLNVIENPSQLTKNTKGEDKKASFARYTIQVAAWPNIEQALNDKDSLIKKGYDAYIEKYYNEKKDITRWRVRVGSFENKKLASKVRKDLSEFRGKDLWIDKID
tara:strand:+ start:11592 stop:12194 length:603 start_codon:yes stop_codon:yes gene_type:complete